MSLVHTLTDVAFSKRPLSEANSAIEDARVTHTEGAVATSYEVVLPQLSPDEFLIKKALPKLVYFLDSRGAKLPRAGALFVTLFTNDGLLFIDGTRFVEAVAAAAGLSMAELVRRYGLDGKGEPLLLGGAP